MHFQHVKNFADFIYAAVTGEDKSFEARVENIRSHPIFQRLQDGEPIEPNYEQVVARLLENLKGNPFFGDRYRRLTPDNRKELIQAWQRIIRHHS